MANEISVASMLSDGLISNFILGEFRARNANPDDLRAALENIPWMSNMGTNSVRVGLHDDEFVYAAATSEIVGGASNSDPNWGYFALTPSRRLLRFEMTDLLAGTRSAAGPSPELFVGIMMRATGRTITEMVCAAAATATAEVGDGSGPMTVDLVHDAIAALRATATPGPYNVVLTSAAFSEFQESLRGEVGSAVFNPATEEMLTASAGTYQGEWRGVRFWVTERVDTSDAGVITQCFAFGGGGIQYTEAPIAPFMADAKAANTTILDMGNFGVELQRDGNNGLTALLGNYYPAVALGQDDAVVRIQVLTPA